MQTITIEGVDIVVRHVAAIGTRRIENQEPGKVEYKAPRLCVLMLGD